MSVHSVIDSHLLSVDSHLAEVCEYVQSLCADWKLLGDRLGIEYGRIEAIDRDEQSCQYKLRELVASWLRRQSERQSIPSWKSLADAVRPLDKTLAEVIARQHQCSCLECLDVAGIRSTPVGTEVQGGNVVGAAKALQQEFIDLLSFTSKEIDHVHLDELRCRINAYTKCQKKVMNETTEQHLNRIEDYERPQAILNYLHRHDFIGYINYGLIEVFQEVCQSPLLKKQIKEYEKDYHCFLRLSLKDIHAAFRECPDLQPDYPVGLPQFTVYLESEWDGRSMYEWKELFEQRFSWPKTLIVVKISENCIIITYAVWPSMAEAVANDLTDPKLIASFKVHGVGDIDISPELMAYSCSQPEEINEGATEHIVTEVTECDTTLPTTIDDYQKSLQSAMEQLQLEKKKVLFAYEHNRSLQKTSTAAAEDTARLQTNMTTLMEKLQKIEAEFELKTKMLIKKEMELSETKKHLSDLSAELEENKKALEQKELELYAKVKSAAEPNNQQSVDILRQYYDELHKVLSASPSVLESLADRYYRAQYIDLGMKTAIMQSERRTGARTLLDHLILLAEQSSEYLPRILSIMRLEVPLLKIVDEMDSRVISSTSLDLHDLVSTAVLEAGKLKESFFTLTLDIMSAADTMKIDVTDVKLMISLFYNNNERDANPQIQAILANMETSVTTTDGAICFMIKNNLVGYLNLKMFEFVFGSLLSSNAKVIGHIESYKQQLAQFFRSTPLKALAYLFKKHPHMRPVTPAVKIILRESWKSRSLYQLNEVMAGLEMIPDHLMIIDIEPG